MQMAEQRNTLMLRCSSTVVKRNHFEARPCSREISCWVATSGFRKPEMRVLCRAVTDKGCTAIHKMERDSVEAAHEKRQTTTNGIESRYA